MDFIGGALPNVMFLIGVIAIGIGLGLEFKIIEIRNGLSPKGRIGAGLIGIALITTSIVLYLLPAPTASSLPATATTVASTGVPAPTREALVSQVMPTATPTTIPTATPTTVPTATPTTIPTAMPTTIPSVVVPDIRNMTPKDAAKKLEQVGLRIGEPQPSCASLGVSNDLVINARKDRIICQGVAPGASMPQQSSITYVLSNAR